MYSIYTPNHRRWTTKDYNLVRKSKIEDHNNLRPNPTDQINAIKLEHERDTGKLFTDQILDLRCSTY